eukprot:1276384-Pleurochrysis_carterae.AAC.2
MSDVLASPSWPRAQPLVCTQPRGFAMMCAGTPLTQVCTWGACVCMRRLAHARALARAQLVEDAAERPDVGLGVVRLALEQLGAHVVRSADVCAPRDETPGEVVKGLTRMRQCCARPTRIQILPIARMHVRLLPSARTLGDVSSHAHFPTRLLSFSTSCT